MLELLCRADLRLVQLCVIAFRPPQGYTHPTSGSYTVSRARASKILVGQGSRKFRRTGRLGRGEVSFPWGLLRAERAPGLFRSVFARANWTSRAPSGHDPAPPPPSPSPDGSAQATTIPTHFGPMAEGIGVRFTSRLRDGSTDRCHRRVSPGAGEVFQPIARSMGAISGLDMNIRQGRPVRWFSIMITIGPWSIAR